MVGNVAKTIASDGKEALKTTALLLTHVGRITLLVRGLYLILAKFPALTRGIKALGAELMKFSLVKKAVDSVTDAFKRLAATEGFKNVVAAVAAPALVKGMLLVAGAAAIASAALLKFFLHRSKAANDVKDLSETMEATTRAVQAIRIAADSLDVPMDSVLSVIQNIRKAQSEFATGSDEMREAVDRLGIEGDEFKNADPVEIFKGMSRAMREGRIQGGEYTAFLKVLGREAKSLETAMRSGLAEKIDQSAGGFIINRNNIDMLDEAHRELKDLWATSKSFVAWASSGVAAGGLSVARRGLAVRRAVMAAVGNFGDLGPALEGLVESEMRAADFRDPATGERNERSDELNRGFRRRESIRAAEAEEAAALAKKNDEREREVELSKMSLRDRRASLEAERDSLSAQMSSTQNAVERQKIRERVLELEQKILGTRGRGSSSVGEARQVDALQRIGLFRGNATGINRLASRIDAQLLVQRNMLNTHQLELRALDRIIREAEKTNRALA